MRSRTRAHAGWLFAWVLVIAATDAPAFAADHPAPPRLRQGVAVVPENAAGSLRRVPLDAYVNPGGATQLYYAGQGGAEAIDDVHAVAPGPYSQVSFEVYEPTVGVVFDAEVSFYVNPLGTDDDLQPLAGPFTVSAITSGRQLVTLDLPEVVQGGPDLWIGIRFTSASAGLLINAAPTLGISHDLYVENGRLYWFGGTPVANFAIALVADEPSTTTPPNAPEARQLDVFPNPFNPRTTVAYRVDLVGPVTIEVFDTRGTLVRTLVRETSHRLGRFEVTWEGDDDEGRACASGIYRLRLRTESGTELRAAALIR